MKNPYEEIKSIERKYLPNIQDVEILLGDLDIDCQRTGKYIKINCPACEKSDKISLSLYDKTGNYTWCCWNNSCAVHKEVGGNLIGLIRAIKGINYADALDLIKSALLVT